MKNLTRLNAARATTRVRLLVPAAAVIALGGVVAGPVTAAPAAGRGKPSYPPKAAKFKQPQVKHGVLTINAGANNTHSGATVINTGTVKLQRVTANNSLLASNVSAYYQFNDSSNVGKDSSPNANDVFDVFGTATISTATMRMTIFSSRCGRRARYAWRFSLY